MEPKTQKNTGLIITVILLMLALATSIAILLPPFIRSQTQSSDVQESAGENIDDQIATKPATEQTRTKVNIIFSMDTSMGDYVKKCLNCAESDTFAYSSVESKTHINKEDNGISVEMLNPNGEGLSGDINANFDQAVKKVIAGMFGDEGERLLFLLADGRVAYLYNDDAGIVKDIFQNVDDVVDLLIVEKTSETTGSGSEKGARNHTTLAIRSDGSFYDLTAEL